MRRTIIVALGLALCRGCFEVNVTAPQVGDGPAGGSDKSASPNGALRGWAPSQLPLSGSWKDVAIATAGQIFLDATEGTLFYAYDTLAYPKGPVELGARLQSAAGFGGIQNVELAFVLNGRTVSTARTDESGIARIKWTPPKAGSYDFLVKVQNVDKDELEPLKQLQPAPLLVAARDKGTEFVVIDLDHTVVDASFFRVLLGGATPAADSVRVTKRLAQKYRLIYLTQRPDLLATKSKSWLRSNDYPPGPLLVSGIRELASGSREYKQARLTQVMKSYPRVRIGIGDKISDAQVYLDAGLTAYLLPHYDQDPQEMLAMARQVEDLGDDAGEGRIQVVRDWQQIEAGIFNGRQFPADDYASWLGQQARQLEQTQRQRERDDD